MRTQTLAEDNNVLQQTPAPARWSWSQGLGEAPQDSVCSLTDVRRKLHTALMLTNKGTEQ
jgi:hypothetical protein